MINYQEEVMRLAKEKGFPMQKSNKNFLIQRIEVELEEVKHYKNDENLKEEIIDVIIQSIQLLSVMGGDLEEEFKKKMEINFKRNWKLDSLKK